VSRGAETSLGCKLLNHLGDDPLERWRRCDINHPAAGDAEQMVMMFGQILCKLESSELVFGSDPSNYPGALEIDQVPVCRTPRNIRKLGCNVGDTHWMTDRREQLDDRSAPRGVAMISSPEPSLDELVQRVVS